MANVKIKQFKNKAKEPVAGLTPEHAIYDKNGVRLDAKLGNINLQEFRDLQQQCVNNINAKVAEAEAEIDAKYEGVSQLTQASMIGSSAVGLEGSNVQDNLNDAGERLSELEEKKMVSISLFQRIAVIGDSFSSGGIYGIKDIQDGEHYPISWVQIMARKAGITGVNYAYPGFNCKQWLNDYVYGAGKMDLDEKCDLYVVFLGITPEKKMTEDVSIPIGNAYTDINKTNPNLNADTFCGNYGRVVSRILSHDALAKIILVQPIIIEEERKKAIADIAEFFNIPTFAMDESSFYRSSFYKRN